MAHVPKNFYQNFRTNMVRDAHDIVTELLAGRLQNAELGPDGKVCIPCEEAKLVDCECIDEKKKNKNDPNVSSHDMKSTSHKPKERRKRKTFYELSRPYQPCRRGCSCNHNPFWHAERMRKEHLMRANQGTTRVMLMRVN